MCMGLGCNAVGVTGCRIIDSPRERLIAILTNSFVPCNGRLPMMITLITLFFAGVGNGGTWLGAVLLALLIMFGICMTFCTSQMLSHTWLKGVPSSYILELPPYRRPQFGKVIVRSMFDRTLFVLGRAISAAAPAGLLIWILANVQVADGSLLIHCTSFLDPFAKQLGMDGVILMAFILALPANEIVLPIILMSYLGQGSLTELNGLNEIKDILIQNGWTWLTALQVVLFSLLHWPCATTLLTVRKETGSWKWTAASLLIPTALGMAVCFVINKVYCLVS